MLLNLMSKTEEEACNLIEAMALNNYQWSSERGQPKRVGGKYDIDALTLLTAKMEVVTPRQPSSVTPARIIPNDPKG